MDVPPVSDSFVLLKHKTCVRTKKHWVVLCVVRAWNRTSLRLYRYVWRESENEWKVDLARFPLEDIDVCKIAIDSMSLASEFGIQLNWSNSATSLTHPLAESACNHCGIAGKVRELPTSKRFKCEICDWHWTD
jgi:hypothetical protein